MVGLVGVQPLGQGQVALPRRLDASAGLEAEDVSGVRVQAARGRAARRAEHVADEIVERLRLEAAGGLRGAASEGGGGELRLLHLGELRVAPRRLLLQALPLGGRGRLEPLPLGGIVNYIFIDGDIAASGGES